MNNDFWKVSFVHWISEKSYRTWHNALWCSKYVVGKSKNKWNSWNYFPVNALKCVWCWKYLECVKSRIISKRVENETRIHWFITHQVSASQRLQLCFMAVNAIWNHTLKKSCSKWAAPITSFQITITTRIRFKQLHTFWNDLKQSPAKLFPIVKLSSVCGNRVLKQIPITTAQFKALQSRIG